MVASRLQCLSTAKLKASKVICVEANVRSMSDVKQSRQSLPVMDVILSMKIVQNLNKT